MRIVKSAVLYTALALVANVAIAGSALEKLREGDMTKLAVHAEPVAVSALPFAGPEGDVTLADFEGKVLLVNFWATWCAPCREEMPSIAALGEAFPPEDKNIIHFKLFRHELQHVENIGGEIDKILNQRVPAIGAFPFKFVGGESALCRVVAFLED